MIKTDNLLENGNKIQEKKNKGNTDLCKLSLLASFFFFLNDTWSKVFQHPEFL